MPVIFLSPMNIVELILRGEITLTRQGEFDGWNKYLGGYALDIYGSNVKCLVKSIVYDDGNTIIELARTGV